MKAVVLAGGRGKRVDEFSENKNKCMIPIAGQPVIQYSLDHASKTDVDEIIVVVGYRAEEIINHFGNRYGDKRLRYVIQWKQKGLVDAINYTQEALEGDDFMLMLGDEVVIEPRYQEMIDLFRKKDVFAICGVLTVKKLDYIRRTYTVIHDEQNRVFRLIEKPRKPINNLMGTGNCVFRNEIFDYIELTPIHHERNEKELPDLIQCAIDDGKTVEIFKVCSHYSNINTEDDIKLAEGLLHGI